MKYSIIPKPVKYDVKEETVEISDKTEVLCVKEFESVGNMLSEYLHTSEDADNGMIRIDKAKSIASEGYAMYTHDGDIYIKASTTTGAFYAVITLRWILMQCKKQDGKKVINGFLIEDKPNYKHRGMMLDECRHFFGIDTVKSLLYNMSMLKMNVFHWHLSDDQGYRIESKVFPKLNEIGSTREFAGLRGLGQKNFGGEYGPFYYTHEQIREIVAYAKSLHISVIPEIDLPGHCTAIVSAYPEFSCNKEKVNVAVTNGILRQILCAGDEKTFDFIKQLFDELCPLFEGKYFHIGGDEARYVNWKKCPKCQDKMKEKGFKTEKQLQAYFMERVSEILKNHGKECIAWSDCMTDDMDNSIACQYWVCHNKRFVKHQAKKRDVILSPMFNFYFDFKHSKVPVEKVYKYDENRYGFGKKGMRIRGVEAELWTEWIDSQKAVEYSIYPRIAAVAEVGWDRSERRKYKDFKRRLKFYELYLNSVGINYYRIHHSALLTPLKSTYSFGAYGKEYKKNEAAKKQKK